MQRWLFVLLLVLTAAIGCKPPDVRVDDRGSPFDAALADREQAVDRATADHSVPDAEAPDASRTDVATLDAGLLDVTAPDSAAPDASLADAAAPDTAAADVSLPDVSSPEVAAPDTTAPDASLADAAAPDTTVADSILPDVTVSDTATPDASFPDVTAADAAAPDSSLPDVTAPDTPAPDVSVPDAPAGDVDPCGASCPPDKACCDEQCLDIVSGDTANCGGCGFVCGTDLQLPHVQTYTCQASSCQVGTCAPGYADCNASAGCETQKSTNTSCSTALDMGPVGDDPALDPIEVSRSGEGIVPGQSLWFKVHAADSIGSDWKVLVKLFNISAGVDLDLHAYRRAIGNTCTSAPSVPAGTCNQNISGCGGNQENSNRCSASTGNASECVQWFEACTGLMEFDETEIWIEVRHLSGGCGTFDLKIRNNGSNDSYSCANY